MSATSRACRARGLWRTTPTHRQTGSTTPQQTAGWPIRHVSYVTISLCYFCFRWKTVSLLSLVQALIQHLMHHVTVSLQQSKITLQNNCINNTSITQPTLSVYLWHKMYNLQLSRKLLWLEPYCSTSEVHQISCKAGSEINILYLLTGPIRKRVARWTGKSPHPTRI